MSVLAHGVAHLFHSIAGLRSPAGRPIERKVERLIGRKLKACLWRIGHESGKQILSSDEAAAEISRFKNSTQFIAAYLYGTRGKPGLMKERYRRTFEDAHATIQLSLRQLVRSVHNHDERAPKTFGGLQSKLETVGSWYQHVHMLSDSIRRIEGKIFQIHAEHEACKNGLLRTCFKQRMNLMFANIARKERKLLKQLQTLPVL